LEKDFKKNTILIVEDEIILAQNLNLRLKNLGYDTLPFANTGQKALEIIKVNIPDLILMDIRLKGDLDGIDTAMIITDKYSIPIVYLTSLSDEITVSRAKKTGAYGFISKTTNLNNLYTTIEMAIHRYKMEVQVKEKDELLSVTLKSISDAVIGAELDGTIISWNKGANKIFGYELFEVLGKNLSILTPSSFPNEIPENLDWIAKGHNLDHYDTLRKNKNGQILNISINISPIKSISGKITGVSIIANDITEKKKQEREILEISEKESRRIGQDLHDNLGQHLTGLMFQLKVLENSLRKKNLKEEADAAYNITLDTKDAVNITRNLAKNLIKVDISNQGLSTAIAELASFYSGMYEIELIFKENRNVDYDIKDSTIINQLYHITQEALNNSIKHSGASEIRISLNMDETEIRLQISDNGNGEITGNHKGIGLSILKYRANVISGNISFIGTQNKGTTIICRVPII
jgi:PAS domain S-box-containing protein